MFKMPLVITGSARKGGETQLFLNRVFSGKDHTLVDLLDLPLAPYSYAGSYPADDAFREITEELLLHEVIVFATPVYWYAMSGLMKTLFDRLTDLVTIHKQIGRRLKDKSTYMLAVGADPELPEGFEVPFRLTSAYLDMHYRGCIYYSTDHPEPEERTQHAIRAFREKMMMHSQP